MVGLPYEGTRSTAAERELWATRNPPIAPYGKWELLLTRFVHFCTKNDWRLHTRCLRVHKERCNSQKIY